MTVYGKVYAALRQFRKRLIRGNAAQGAIDGKGQRCFAVPGMTRKNDAMGALPQIRDEGFLQRMGRGNAGKQGVLGLKCSKIF